MNIIRYVTRIFFDFPGPISIISNLAPAQLGLHTLRTSANISLKPNPIPKTQFSNYAGHEQELAFLLQNFPALSSFSRSENSPSPEIQKKTAKFGKDMAAAWIRFAHGEAVQGLEDRGEQEEVSDKLLVMGPNYEFKFMTKDEYNREYRKGRVENLWGQIPWQAWFDLGEKLQGC